MIIFVHTIFEPMSSTTMRFLRILFAELLFFGGFYLQFCFTILYNDVWSRGARHVTGDQKAVEVQTRSVRSWYSFTVIAAPSWLSGRRTLPLSTTTRRRDVQQGRIKVHKGPRLDTFMGPLLPSSSLPSFSYPHWSCSVSPTCHSAWQQSVAVFNKLWKQKLINNFNYCLPKH